MIDSPSSDDPAGPNEPVATQPAEPEQPVLRDAWYQSEEPTRFAMIAELQRLKRRTRVRPLPVLAVAAIITAVITYKVATKPVVCEAEVVLALAEGSMANRDNGLPVDQLREYVQAILLPDNKLIQLIEKHNLFRLRKTLGNQFALDELRSAFTIQIWKNSFVYFDEDEEGARRSARISITVTDTDPDHAYDLAHELAGIAIESANEQKVALAAELSAQVVALRDQIGDKLEKANADYKEKQDAIAKALAEGRADVAGILRVDLTAIIRDRQHAEEKLSQIAASPDALASEVAAADLDLTLSIVDERRPDRPNRSGFILIIIASVVGAIALVGSAMVLGAFDSRVHDTDDVARLGLPVLGQIPRFAGDKVGSMLTRGAASARVPSFVRWRSHQ